MYAASDLESGMDRIEQLLGVRPEPGGHHAGAGTQNALLGLGDEIYLEVIAPDPEQALGGTLGASLARMKNPAIRTWAVAVDGNEGLPNQLQSLGLTCQKTSMSRLRPDGVMLQWQIMFPGGHTFGPAMPFFIDWQQSPHPALSLNARVRLISFAVASPTNPDFGETMTQLGLGGYLGSAENLPFELILEGPAGIVTLN